MILLFVCRKIDAVPNASEQQQKQQQKQQQQPCLQSRPNNHNYSEDVLRIRLVRDILYNLFAFDRENLASLHFDHIMSAIRRLYSAGIYGMAKKGESSDFYIGSQTKLRSGLSEHGLNGIKVAVLHNDARAVLSAKILADNGAEVSHYGVKGYRQPNCSNLRELDMSTDEGKSYFDNVVRKADILLDGLGDEGLSKVGLDKHKLTQRNGQLIVATVEGNDAFTAMDTVKNIAIGLYLRERNTSGQVVDTSGASTYQDTLEKYSADMTK